VCYNNPKLENPLINPEFKALLDEMLAIHDRKNHDYATDEDPYANFRVCEMMGVSPFKGIIIRLCDKFSRITGFAQKETLKVKDESIEDTLLDMANYCLLAILLRREETSKRKTETK
jgi:hypothetical protein